MTIDGVNICKCGVNPVFIDDGMSMSITCLSCGNTTDEYLFGAISCDRVERDVINEWNEIICNMPYI